jgi:hypothetical protein
LSPRFKRKSISSSEIYILGPRALKPYIFLTVTLFLVIFAPKVS